MEQIIYWLFIILNDSNIQVRLNITVNIHKTIYLHFGNCAWCYMTVAMDNTHVRLNFNLSKEKGIKHHSY
jgi:hypothetical protein